MKATRDSRMLQFWFPKEEFYTYLQPMVCYSEFCRNAILKEIQLVNSDQYINSKIEYHQNKVKEFKEKKKADKGHSEKLQERLNYYYREYYTGWSDLEYRFQKDRAKREILPELRSLGFKGDAADILNIFRKHDQEGKVLMNEL